MILLARCASLEKHSVTGPVPEIHPGILKGYLSEDELPDSLELLPAPPSEESFAFTLDRDISKNSLTLQDTPRWDLAAEDANLAFPEVAGIFSCAV